MTDGTAPPRIVHVIDRLQVGGMENGLVNLINGTPPERYRHAIVCLRSHDDDFRRRIVRDDVPVVSLNKGDGKDLAVYPRLWRALRDLKPSVEPLAFYSSKQKDVVTDRWPGKDNNLKGVVHMELAVTDAEQTRGLMYRTSLRKNHGMLFVYDAEQDELTYWMKNCKTNLSIAFVDDKGVIVKIHQSMKAPVPGTPDADLERYESGHAAKFAIELDENWFKDNNVVEGDRIFLAPRLLNKE